MRLFPARIAILCLCILALSPGLANAARPVLSNPGWERVEAALKRQDYVEARRIAEELAALGGAEAINGLAVFVAQGVGGPADQKRSRELVERAAAAGSHGAKLNLARQIAASPDESQWPRARGLLTELSKDPRFVGAISYPMGRMMVFAARDDAELRRGVEHLKTAVEFEPTNADAQFLVARAYQAGWGGAPKQPKQAYAHFKAAGDLGDVRALRHMGLARLYGEGVEKDPQAAMEAFKMGAERGDTAAMIDVAVMLALGEGVPKDPLQARAWYARAVDDGSAHALRGLGAMLYLGEGGPNDPIRGRAYLELAAELGDDQAPRLANSWFSQPSQSDRASIDEVKAGWLKKHARPSVD